MIRVGTMLYGYCGGIFRDDYGDKRVEAIGADWIVVRNERGEPMFQMFGADENIDEVLAGYTKPEEKEP